MGKTNKVQTYSFRSRDKKSYNRKIRKKVKSLMFEEEDFILDYKKEKWTNRTIDNLD